MLGQWDKRAPLRMLKKLTKRDVYHAYHLRVFSGLKGAGASEAPGQTKEGVLCK